MFRKIKNSEKCLKIGTVWKKLKKLKNLNNFWNLKNLLNLLVEKVKGVKEVERVKKKCKKCAWCEKSEKSEKVEKAKMGGGVLIVGMFWTWKNIRVSRKQVSETSTIYIWRRKAA
jgi:hypothetical protein